MSKFKCLVLASIWLKILIPINERNLVLQYRDTTIDVERDNIDGLINDLIKLRQSWDTVYDECELVAQAAGISCPSKTVNDIGDNHVNDQTAQVRGRKLTEKMKAYKHSQTTIVETVSLVKNDRDEFRDRIFYSIIDSVVAGLKKRFAAVSNLCNQFDFLWKFLLDDHDYRSSCKNFCGTYSADICMDLIDEVDSLKRIYQENIDSKIVQPVQLLNKLHEVSLQNLFPNLVVALRIFCCIPASVASAERSFSVLKRVKNYHRATMCQDRVNGLATLAIESELAHTLNFESIIDSFASRKARKAPLM